MKVKEMKSILATNKFDNVECNFKIKSKRSQPPQWFDDFVVKEFRPSIININNRLDKLETRIDNLVAKNNLKE